MTASTSGYAPMDISGTAAIPLHRLVLVELRKSIDTLASFWLLMSILILLVLVEGFVLVITLVYSESVSFDDFTAIAAGVTSLLLPVLGIMLVTSEWSQRTAMVTFSIEPRRLRVVLAKLLVGLLLTVATVVAAFAVGFLCTLICEIAQPDNTDWELDAAATVGFLLTQWIAMAGRLRPRHAAAQHPGGDRAVLHLPVGHPDRAVHRERRCGRRSRTSRRT